MKKFLLSTVTLLIVALLAGEALAMQALRWNGREIDGWVCVGNELKPRVGATSANTWILQGNEIRPKSGATSGNTWVRSGNEIRPKSGATSSNTWILQGNTIRPKSGATSSNTWNVSDAPLLVIVGKVILKLF